jgi:hypothetical protein
MMYSGSSGNQIEVDGGRLGQACTLSGSPSELTALRKEQQMHLQSNHHENHAEMKEVEAGHGRQSTALEKK